MTPEANAGTGSTRWQRDRRALAGEPLPAALVDLDVLEANVDRMLAPVRAAQKTLRISTESLRCSELVRGVAARGGAAIRGLMTYTAAETLYWAEQGERDLLLAYPTVHPRDLNALCAANALGATAAMVCDAPEHLAALAAAAERAGIDRLLVVVEVDLALRVSPAHLGVRRSPLRSVEEVVEFAARIAASPRLAFHGVMGYEAQVAGPTDKSPFRAWMNGPKRLVKALSRPRVARRRAEVARALAMGGLALRLRVPAGVSLAPGDPVFFRHAKAGELAEHFAEYLLVRGDRIEARAPTYRGLGRSFLG